VTLLDVYGTGTALLNLIEVCAAAEGVTLPARRYVSAGHPAEVVWDCDQVVIALAVLGEGISAAMQGGGTAKAPGSMVSPGGVPHLPAAQLVAQIVRCAPALTSRGEPPTVAALEASGEEALTDAALLHLVRARWAASAPGAPTDVLLGQVLPAGPSGGFSAMSLTVAVTVTQVMAP